MEEKLTRKISMYWKNQVRSLFDADRNTDAMVEIKFYLKSLYEDLSTIKDCYSKQFDDGYSKIDEQFAYFDYLCDKLLSVFFGKNEYKKLEKKIIEEYLKVSENSNKCLLLAKQNWKRHARFSCLTQNRTFLINKVIFQRNIFNYDNDENKIGFSKSGYAKVEPILKQIFVLEKMCSYKTKKIWNNSLTKIENLDLKKPFKIIVKAIYKNGWRDEGIDDNKQKFMKSKIYSSVSLIDEKTTDKIFNVNRSAENGNLACLVIKPDVENIICANSDDAFSDELINKYNPLEDKSYSSSVELMCEDKVDNKLHQLYARATLTSTPIGLLNNVQNYNEIVMKNIIAVAVISPNKKCENFAKNYAKANNLPYLGCFENQFEELPQTAQNIKK